MLEIIKRTIKDRIFVISIYIVVASLLLIMYTAMFPSFSTQQEQWNQVVKTIPENMMKAFNLQDYSLSSYHSFIASEEYSITWPVLLIILAISFAGGALAGEVEKGTIEILLAQPISRIKLFLSRYLSGLIAITTYVAVTVFLAIPLAEIFNIKYSASHFVFLALIAWLFGWAVFSLAMMLSAIFSDRGKVYFISAGILVLMYVVNIVAVLKESFSDLKYFSFFYYYNPANALNRGQIDHWSYLVFGGTIIVCFVLGLLFFNKRDIAT